MPFTDEDLDAAVGDGALSGEAAAAFRAFIERRRAAPIADEENFRLLTGFNDIFVSIAVVMVLAALGWLAEQAGEVAAGIAIAVASWGLAEFFTRKRRMALPSILLLLAFVGGPLAAIATLPLPVAYDRHSELRIALMGGAGALAAYLHWRRFMVPITVAAGVLCFAAAIILGISSFARESGVFPLLTFLAGLATFALALYWDSSDPQRKTRRADVAFWLHLLAAPAIVHPAFSLLGLSRFSALDFALPSQTPPFVFSIGVAIGLYAVLAIIALIVDRRALMVSSLAYLLYAMNSLFHATGALTWSVALSALIVGGGLLLLSAFWASARRAALKLTPLSWRSRLPAAA